MSQFVNSISKIHFSVYDSNGKWPDGIIAGNWQVLGSFFSCYEIQVEEESSFGGKYCVLGFYSNEKNESSVDSRALMPILGGGNPKVRSCFLNLNMASVPD